MTLRDDNIQKLTTTKVDVLVIGAGINGAVSAAALAAHDCRVAIIDRGDFASFTSQESSNLVWGGIKYLENYEFLLVRKLCKSRNHLLKNYPSMIKEIRFFAPIEKNVKIEHSVPVVMAGIWLYWSMGNGQTRRPRLLSNETLKKEEPSLNMDRFQGGVEYSDAFLLEHDSRFVFNFVKSAMDHGGIAANYIEATSSTRNSEGLWQTKFLDLEKGTSGTIESRIVINAAGPFVDSLNGKNRIASSAQHVFSKGIHLIVKRIAKPKHVLTFFDDQDRLFFVIPLGPVSVIGTTDTPMNNPHAEVTQEDRNYVIDNINRRMCFDEPLTLADIISERCGVRPLAIAKEKPSIPAVETASQTDAMAGKKWYALSRKHILDIDAEQNYLSILGGKLTDCLNVGEEIVDAVRNMGVQVASAPVRWYGEPPESERVRFYQAADKENLEGFRLGDTFEPLKERLWRRYGLAAFELLEKVKNDRQAQRSYLPGAAYLTCELEYQARTEMITKLEDFVRRRTRLELILGHQAVIDLPGLKEVCSILFGTQGEAKLNEYIRKKVGNDE